MSLFRTEFELFGHFDPNLGMARKSLRQLFLSLTIMLFGFFFLITYEAFVVASLVNEPTDFPYRTLKDL